MKKTVLEPNFALLDTLDNRELFLELNQEQLTAVTNIDGNYLVLAGAGSGKTRIIVYRAFFLLSLGIPDDDILIITFTRKAILEVRERVESLMPNSNICIETFHSLAFRFLKKYSSKKRFQILTTEILEEAIKNNESFKKVLKFMRKDEILKVLLDKKIDYSKFCSNAEELKSLKTLISEYEILKKESDFFTFDEMLEKFYFQLKNGTILKKFKYIMVDEYQDTDILQVDILKEFVKTANLMVVGDDFQSIYAFKGAKIENILFFNEVFENVNTIVLKRNYRNAKPILDIANHLSKYLKYTFRKQLLPHNNSENKPILAIFKTHTDEVNYILNKISSFTKEKTTAILFRNFIHMELFIKELIEREVEFSVVENPFLQNNLKGLKNTPNSNLTLLTIHSSKGLEWDYVFIPLLLEGIVPSTLGEKESVHEEMRLFYVAITRAKEGLFLSYPLSFYNDMGLFRTPSSFLDKIEDRFLVIERC